MTHTDPATRSSSIADYYLPLVDDFELSGDGTAQAWSKAPWADLHALEPKANAATRCKLLYSSTGLYALFYCEDSRLRCNYMGANAKLFTQDIVEIFVQPDETVPLYLEYELSPLNEELLLLIANRFEGAFHGWIPWDYVGTRAARHATAAQGGPLTPGGAVRSWTAECYLPFKLFVGFGQPPHSGDVWRGNLFRKDYDDGHRSWAWSPPTNGNFHAWRCFGRIHFS